MKHTVCENCLDDLEDYTWVYCDDCWQKLLADLKKARPVVTREQLSRAIIPAISKMFQDYDMLIGRIIVNLKAEGVEIEPAHVNSKVDERRKI